MININNNLPIVCVFHKNCSDGFCSAVNCKRRYPNAEFCAVRPNELPTNIENKNVIILDCCYSKEVLLDLKHKAKSIIVLDHHKSNMEALGMSSNINILDGLIVFNDTLISPFFVGELIRTGRKNEAKSRYPELNDDQLDLAEITIFDMKRSGAGLSWDFLVGGERNWLSNFVEDKDLWNWKWEGAREVNCCIESFPFTFEAWEKLESQPIEKWIEEGEIILRYKQQLVNSICEKAQEVEVDGSNILVVNTNVLQNEVCQHLAVDRDFSASWYENEEGKRIYSFRSKPGKRDVSLVAIKLGGGGHFHSSSAKLDIGKKI